MTRVLFVGEDPDKVDFSDPALPPGTTAEKIKAGIDLALKDMRGRGWEAEPCMISPDDEGVAELETALNGTDYDAVVIGGGLRVPPKMLQLFETVVNAVRKAAPMAAIAFNTKPEDSGDAVARTLKL